MPIAAIEHVQLAMPPGMEPAARAFYEGVLVYASPSHEWIGQHVGADNEQLQWTVQVYRAR